MAQAVIRVDPRIRARRVAVRRAEGRRRLRFVLGGLAIVAAIAGAWGLTRTPLLDLDHVQVDGVVSGSVAEVDAAVALTNGAPLLDVDLHTIETRVEALPWVETAHVRRDWPGTVRVDVVERVPVARIPTGDGSAAVVDVHGVVTAFVPADQASGLPVVDVALEVELGGTQTSALPGLAVVAALPTDLVAWTERVLVGVPDGGVTTADGDPDVVLDLAGRATAELGDTTLLADKLTALRAVLARADLTCITTIDVSVADLTTVTRDPACEGRVTASDG